MLIVGGANGPAVLSSAEIYDPSTGEFTLTGAMNFARQNHTVTLLADGKVLIAGGVDGATTYDSAEIFDPAANHGTGKFDLLGNAMTFARGLAAAALIALGPGAEDALIAGGAGTSLDTPSSANLFEPGANPLSGTFVAAGNSMSALRIGPTVTPLQDGDLLVTGGTCDNAATGGQASTDLLMATGPDAGNFAPGGTMLDGLVNHAAALLPDGQVLVTGGWRFVPGSCADPCVSMPKRFRAGRERCRTDRRIACPPDYRRDIAFGWQSASDRALRQSVASVTGLRLRAARHR